MALKCGQNVVFARVSDQNAEVCRAESQAKEKILPQIVQ